MTEIKEGEKYIKLIISQDCILVKNPRKEKNEKAPDLVGSIRVSAWVNTKTTKEDKKEEDIL